MIDKTQFLKLIGNMSQEELDQYWTDLQRWNDTSYPRLCALTDAWQECDIKDYKEGILLCSALRSAREFCTQPMAEDAQKRLKRIRYYINEIDKFIKRNRLDPHIIKSAKIGIVPQLPTVNEFGDLIPTPPAPRITPETLPVLNGSPVESQSSLPAGRAGVGLSMVNDSTSPAGVDGGGLFHPSHLSEYISRLSPQLQAESANLSTWYLELSEYHYILEKLVNDSRASQADRRYYARLVTKIENKILSFYHRVNAEWEELNGKVISQEVKKELETERRSADISTVNEGGSMTKAEIEALTDPELREKFKNQRIKRDIRYLAERVRRKDAAEHIRQVLLELKEWNHLITKQSAEKVKEWYDIDVDPSQIEPEYTPEEKEAIRKERRAAINAKYKASLKTKTAAEKEAQKRIRAEERAAKRAAEKEEEHRRYQEMARAMGEDTP